MSMVLWFVFLVLTFLYTLRLHQTQGRKEQTGFILLGLALAVMLATGMVAGWDHGLGMLLAWFALPFAFRPLAVKLGDSYPDSKKKQRDPAADARMSRLNKGEISLDEYFKDGDRAGREWKERLATIARQPEIAAVLKQNQVSFRQFCVLREQLSQIPDLEWKILGSARFVAELIDLSGQGKSPQDLARIFRAREKRSTAMASA